MGTARRMTSRPDRHHHGAAEALHEAPDRERFERTGERAADRGAEEDRERSAERGARSEPVRHPAAHGNENGEADEVGGDGELQGDDIDAEVARDRRQRRGEDRGVHRLHEQGRRDDERDDGDRHRAEGLVIAPHSQGRGQSTSRPACVCQCPRRAREKAASHASRPRGNDGSSCGQSTSVGAHRHPWASNAWRRPRATVRPRAWSPRE